ncbi:hypothetical protein B0H16DRAFT_1745985 [Mycena metata]|uniref:Uncharacterized protein n=1 Tax=Mycena metata TaxID=1033252 RepID=A0AAD7H048_9AGAR|nr:hypothetical protein B0H16DRAFT_1745985 [Mycena metata]
MPPFLLLDRFHPVSTATSESEWMNYLNRGIPSPLLNPYSRTILARSERPEKKIKPVLVLACKFPEEGQEAGEIFPIASHSLSPRGLLAPCLIETRWRVDDSNAPAEHEECLFELHIGMTPNQLASGDLAPRRRYKYGGWWLVVDMDAELGARRPLRWNESCGDAQATTTTSNSLRDDQVLVPIPLGRLRADASTQTRCLYPRILKLRRLRNDHTLVPIRLMTEEWFTSPSTARTYFQAKGAAH